MRGGVLPGMGRVKKCKGRLLPSVCSDFSWECVSFLLMVLKITTKVAGNNTHLLSCNSGVDHTGLCVIRAGFPSGVSVSLPFQLLEAICKVSQLAQWKRICLSMQEVQEMQVQSLGRTYPLE